MAYRRRRQVAKAISRYVGCPFPQQAPSLQPSLCRLTLSSASGAMWQIGESGSGGESGSKLSMNRFVKEPTMCHPRTCKVADLGFRPWACSDPAIRASFPAGEQLSVSGHRAHHIMALRILSQQHLGRLPPEKELTHLRHCFRFALMPQIKCVSLLSQWARAMLSPEPRTCE